jgi:hypothetical protein
MQGFENLTELFTGTREINFIALFVPVNFPLAV